MCEYGSEYQPCGPPCEQTCHNIDEPEPWCQTSQCVEGCFCPAGYVKDGGCIVWFGFFFCLFVLFLGFIWGWGGGLNYILGPLNIIMLAFTFFSRMEVVSVQQAMLKPGSDALSVHPIWASVL